MRKTVILSLIAANFLFADNSPNNVVVLDTVAVESISAENDELGYVIYEKPSVNRTGITLKDTPYTIDSINIQKNKNYGTNDLASILEGVAGVDTSYDMRGEGVKVRGFSVDSADIYLDGIRASGQIRRSTANIERVEVLKGPASVLYGRTSGGGVINMVSKKANFTPRTAIGTKFGSWDRAGLSLDTNNIINDNWAFRINSDYEKGGSFRDGIKYKNKMVSPSLAYISDNGEINWSLQYTYDNAWRVPDRNPSKEFYDDLGISYSKGFSRQGDYVEDELHFLKSTLKYDFNPDWSLEWALGHRGQSQKFDHYYNLRKKDANYIQSYYWQDTANETLQNSFVLKGKFDVGQIPNRLTLGYDYADEKRKPKLATTPEGFNPTINPLQNRPFKRDDFQLRHTADNSHKGESHSIFIYNLAELTQNFKVGFGGRFDWYEFATNDKLKAKKNSYNDSQFSPQIGVIYTVFDDHNLYASYSKSFSPYGGRGMISIPTDQNPNTFSEPEYNRQYETGLKSDWMDGLIVTTLAFYQNEHYNIRYRPDAEAKPDYWAVRGKEMAKGVDFSAIGMINDDWYLKGSLGYMDTKIAQDKTNPKLEGKKLRGTSAVQGSIFARYAPNGKWFVETGVIHNSKTNDYDTKTFKNKNLNGWTRVDAMAGYRFNKNLNLTLSVNNITDEKYWKSSSMPGAKRSFFTRINYEF